MDHTRKKNIKRVVSMICIAAVVALLAAMPLLAKQETQSDGPRASILSGTVETGSIATELVGGGTLTAEDAVAVTVPAAVKLTQYLVSNGDAVREGDPIASVDRVTVMTAIAQVQETLDYLAEQIETESEEDTDGKVAALAGGTVKILYAVEGESVRDIMLEHGALAVLSLDGRMAVKLEARSALTAGTAVTVTLSDGTAVSGRVESNLDGEMVITVEDDGYAVGEKVQAATEEGTAIGTGALYIHSPWNATAYAGTVDSVEVEEGDEVDAGDTLLELSDLGASAAYQQLVNQRREYEELMLELFELYQTETITAPGDGVVSGVDEDSAQLLAAGNQGYTLELLANSPNGDDETLYANYVGTVAAVGIDGLVLRINPTPVAIADYKDLSGVPTDSALMSESVIYSAQAPVYELSGGEWVQIGASAITSGDVLLLACDAGGSFVWVVRIGKAQAPVQPEMPGEPTQPTEPVQPGEPADPTQPSEPETPTDPTTPSTPTMPGGSGTVTQPGITIPSTGGSWSSMGGFAQSGVTEEEEFELYGLETVDIALVTPQSTMTMEITIDELDISRLTIGQEADITVDALTGEHFTGTITDMGNTGVSNGGNSKFTVEITLDRAENMLSGMNATAVITTQTTRDVPTVPVAALVEEGTQTVVYTGYDEENEALTDPVNVTVGVSDGENAQILSGLDAGAAYYYAYYDTLEVSNIPDFGGPSFMGR